MFKGKTKKRGKICEKLFQPAYVEREEVGVHRLVDIPSDYDRRDGELLFTNPPSDLPKTQMALQLFANLVGMFAWEIIQALPEKNCLRQLPSYCQTVASVGLLLASFGGAFLNFYYSIFMWDKILHLLGGAEAVFMGYELATAMQKRDKKQCDLPIVLLCALGFSFFISTCWESSSSASIR